MANVKEFIKKNKTMIIIVALILAIIPVDPTDIIDAGTPILESAVIIVTLLLGKNK